MRLTEAAYPIFARHETFHPRYGWFRKAYGAAAGNPRVFEQEDAPLRIGVGKNMARSIRFWGLSAGLIQETSSRLTPTPFGRNLFGASGWDPWMEDPGTLWLLHWRLLRANCRLPVWWFVFHEFQAAVFAVEDLEAAVTTRLDPLEGWWKRRPSRSAVKKDISALLRAYAPVDKRGRVAVDDTLDAPLRELQLIGRSPDGRYRFHFGEKPLLPPEILAATALDYASQSRPNSNTVPLAVLASEPGSPGRAFRLTEPEIAATIEPVAARTEGLDLVASAGAPQLSWTAAADKLRDQVLSAYFRPS